MMSRYDLEELKKIAKYLAGFKDENGEYVKCPRYERTDSYSKSYA